MSEQNSENQDELVVGTRRAHSGPGSLVNLLKSCSGSFSPSGKEKKWGQKDNLQLWSRSGATLIARQICAAARYLDSFDCSRSNGKFAQKFGLKKVLPQRQTTFLVCLLLSRSAAQLKENRVKSKLL